MPEGNFLTAAEILATAKEASISTFDAVRKSMGIGVRRARYLVVIHEAYAHLPVSREALLAIGWTKLQMVAPHVTAETVHQWLDFIAGRSVREVRLYLEGKQPVGQLHCLLFYLDHPDYEVVAKGLSLFGAKVEGGMIDGKEPALVSAMAHLAKAS